jgi:hypothetical protein
MKITKIINWIKLEVYTPQRNKAKASVAYHRDFAKYLEEKSVKKHGSRQRAEIDYNHHMADSWQLKLEQLNLKILKIERRC